MGIHFPKTVSLQCIRTPVAHRGWMALWWQSCQICASPSKGIWRRSPKKRSIAKGRKYNWVRQEGPSITIPLIPRWENAKEVHDPSPLSSTRHADHFSWNLNSFQMLRGTLLSTSIRCSEVPFISSSSMGLMGLSRHTSVHWWLRCKTRFTTKMWSSAVRRWLEDEGRLWKYRETLGLLKSSSVLSWEIHSCCDTESCVTG